jgi:hypothetical protein
VIPLWVKRLTAFGWLLACLYGIGYFQGRVAPSTLPENVLLYTLLPTGACLAALPLVLTWLPRRRPTSLPICSVNKPEALRMAIDDVMWKEFLKVHEEEFSELTVLPEVTE